MTRFGFKEITPSNWLEPDGVLRGFVRMSTEGQFLPITSDDYLRHILSPKLLESVPADVQALFEVARGAMAYGYFFYPLYTLAAEQLFRVAEAAIAHKCKALGVPKSRKTFEKRIFGSWIKELFRVRSLCDGMQLVSCETPRLILSLNLFSRQAMP